MALLDRFPRLQKVAQFAFSYARKATIQGGVGTAFMSSLVSALPTDSSSDLINWLGSLPVYISVPAFFVIFFVTTYYPPNGPKPAA